MSKRHISLFLPCILLSTLFMASSFPSGKYLIRQVAVPPFLLGGCRFVLAGVVLLLFCLCREGIGGALPFIKGSVRKGLRGTILMGVLQTAGAMGLLNLSFKTLSASISSVIFFTNPLWVALLAHMLSGERLNVRRLCALGVGITGVVICMGPRGQLDMLGALYALGGAICWSLCTLVTRKLAFDSSMVAVAAWQMLWGGIVLMLMVPIIGERLDGIQWSSWAVIWSLWLVGPASIGSFTLWFVALQASSATQTSSFLFLVPLFSTVLSVMLLNDALPLSLLAGCVLILLALWAINKC